MCALCGDSSQLDTYVRAVNHSNRLVDMDGHLKDKCKDEIGLCFHSIGSILGSMINTIVRAYVII